MKGTSFLYNGSSTPRAEFCSSEVCLVDFQRELNRTLFHKLALAVSWVASSKGEFLRDKKENLPSEYRPAPPTPSIIFRLGSLSPRSMITLLMLLSLSILVAMSPEGPAPIMATSILLFLFIVGSHSGYIGILEELLCRPVWSRDINSLFGGRLLFVYFFDAMLLFCR